VFGGAVETADAGMSSAVARSGVGGIWYVGGGASVIGEGEILVSVSR